jgi:hypothetical protein
MLCFFPQIINPSDTGWITQLLDELLEKEVKVNKAITYTDLIGTFWIPGDPINPCSEKNRNSFSLVAFTQGFIFLPDNMVLVVELEWHAVQNRKIDHSQSNELKYNINSYVGIVPYRIENNKLVIDFYSIILCLRDNKMYFDNLSNMHFSFLFLAQTFPFIEQNNIPGKCLWNEYIW